MLSHIIGNCTQEQLEPILAVADISAHLAQLCHLYEGTSPAISQLYAELAPLSPESLPGADPSIPPFAMLLDCQLCVQTTPCLFAR